MKMLIFNLLNFILVGGLGVFILCFTDTPNKMLIGLTWCMFMNLCIANILFVLIGRLKE